MSGVAPLLEPPVQQIKVKPVKLRLDFGIVSSAVVFLAVLLAFMTVLSSSDRAAQRAAIQKCWNQGGVPIFRWYTADALAACQWRPR